MNEFLHVASISLPMLLQGLRLTIEISVLSIVFAFIGGLVVGYMCISPNKIVEGIARIFIKIFRCTPFMVQVYLAYYGLPSLGINVSAFWTGVIILSLYTSAYAAVILESGVKAISKGQYESAAALGMPRLKIMYRIILPQTIRMIVPSLTGQFVQTVKDSSILSIITVAEMTMMTKEAIGITFSPLFVYICAGVLYWALNLVIEFISGRIEKKYNRVRI
ncbi:amino acid ABC transporter permease [Huintestinicola sp.]|uniref:amino acid ABC transporter permease n=1 Tax=Huintestinicola sp. TaxID=2981661 RepID=UPI003D7CCCAC